MSAAPQHIRAHTVHSRIGGVENRFRYGIDYVLIDPAEKAAPVLFSRNGFNLWSVQDSHHGGGEKRGRGRGATWVREHLQSAGAPEGLALRVLTQPSFLGYTFNPVSFWLAFDGTELKAVIAEVDTPFGDRHSYLCHRPGFALIRAEDRITTQKALHVSPFQEVAGQYAFNFDISPERVNIKITHTNGEHGVVATLAGTRVPLTSRGIMAASLRRPCGAARAMALIHWQALKLKLKGATYRRRPEPPKSEVTPCSS
ncbi:DUF1365 domain-containing protein [Vannielia sp.]|uniref:DUF1365 domain-containing protein n=1 Tax=Vannielia sp. TaxID=2813045 RepID=UPI002631D6E4|nr:DUF1365 domain-containing protein [Vannielia sp.]MDF1871856.1 DUF1365 domain-containing protein [Vannielia sp.]